MVGVACIVVQIARRTRYRQLRKNRDDFDLMNPLWADFNRSNLYFIRISVGFQDVEYDPTHFSLNPVMQNAQVDAKSSPKHGLGSFLDDRFPLSGPFRSQKECCKAVLSAYFSTYLRKIKGLPRPDPPILFIFHGIASVFNQEKSGFA
jgi:hypothetical protein